MVSLPKYINPSLLDVWSYIVETIGFPATRYVGRVENTIYYTSGVTTFVECEFRLYYMKTTRCERCILRIARCPELAIPWVTRVDKWKFISIVFRSTSAIPHHGVEYIICRSGESLPRPYRGLIENSASGRQPRETPRCEIVFCYERSRITL